MENIAVWQGATLGGIVAWILISSYLNVTRKLRSFLQPWVAHHVIAGTPLIFQIQKYQHWFFDALFSGLSCVVSVPFYTAFLPLLFWDMVSAPRPSSPPVRRITATKDEEDNALEYGLPSSHTLNTVCLSGYLLHYVLSYIQYEDVSMKFFGLALVCSFVGLIGLGRIYLGMHSLINIIGGLGIGLVILAFGLQFMNMSTILLSQDKMVSGIQQTYHQFHHEAVARIFTPQLTISNFVGRMLVGIPMILLVKFCSKALVKWILPGVSNTLGIPIKSTNYIPTLNGNGKKSDESKQSGYIQRLFFFSTG